VHDLLRKPASLGGQSEFIHSPIQHRVDGVMDYVNFKKSLQGSNARLPSNLHLVDLLLVRPPLAAGR
jgi:hypothetical protein